MKPAAAIQNAISLREASPSPTVAQHPLWTGAGLAAANRGMTPPVRLTPRQLEVLALLCEGLPNKLICRRLNIATGTVKIHISCILRELGVTSRLQAALSARRFGLLDEWVVGAPEQGADPAAMGNLATAGGSPEYHARQLAAAA